MLTRHCHEERVECTTLVLRRATQTHVPWGAQGLAALDSLGLAGLNFDLLYAVAVCVRHKGYSGLLIIADSLQRADQGFVYTVQPG